MGNSAWTHDWTGPHCGERGRVSAPRRRIQIGRSRAMPLSVLLLWLAAFASPALHGQGLPPASQILPPPPLTFDYGLTGQPAPGGPAPSPVIPPIKYPAAPMETAPAKPAPAAVPQFPKI